MLLTLTLGQCLFWIRQLEYWELVFVFVTLPLPEFLMRPAPGKNSSVVLELTSKTPLIRHMPSTMM